MLPDNTFYSGVNRWVAFRLGHLGDVALTTGVLAHLGETHGWTFDFITKREWSGIFIGNPHVRKVISLDRADLAAVAQLALFRRVAAEYQGWGFLDLHGNLRSRLLSALWQGPVARYPKMSLERRIFLASGGRFGGEALRSFSVTERYTMALGGKPPAKEALLPRIWLADEERRAAREKLDSVYGANVRPVALHPFAAHPFKTWPASHWHALVSLCESKGIPWLVLGKGTALFPGHNRDMVNQSSLRESCALLSHCRVLVTGDSGPMHLAAAVQTPVVALFGPTTREWGFYPAGPQDVVLESSLPCRPCSLHGRTPCKRDGECLTGIAPETVLAALE